MSVLGDVTMTKTVLLLNDTDCNSLQENGDFQIVNPVNGPTDAVNVLITVSAPGQAIRPDNVKQTATVLPAGTVFERRFVPGTGWAAWTAPSGGGGGTAETMAISSGFKTLWATAFSTLENVIAPLGDYDGIQAALVPGLVIGPADTLNAQLGVLTYAFVNMLSICGQSQTSGADPGVNDDGAGTNGVKYKSGSLWLNASTHDVFILVDPSTGAAVWRKITFAA